MTSVRAEVTATRFHLSFFTVHQAETGVDDHVPWFARFGFKKVLCRREKALRLWSGHASPNQLQPTFCPPSRQRREKATQHSLLLGYVFTYSGPLSFFQTKITESAPSIDSFQGQQRRILDLVLLSNVKLGLAGIVWKWNICSSDGVDMLTWGGKNAFLTMIKGAVHDFQKNGD